MGLAAPKKKTKLSFDPNNTRWTNNTQSFGHKILTSQGWKKGEFLGAKNASHAQYHTAANYSHIRVALKDDNLGLGAKIGTGVGHGECTGLDAFKDLLGRLNGKTHNEIEKEQKARADVRRIVYTDKRWGSINFVSGGYLVGDMIKDLVDSEIKRTDKCADRVNVCDEDLEKHKSNSSTKGGEKDASKKSKKTKKRKANMIDEVDMDDGNLKPSKKKVLAKDIKDKDKSSLANELDDSTLKSDSKSKKTREHGKSKVEKEERRKKRKTKEEDISRKAKKLRKHSTEKHGKMSSDVQETKHNDSSRSCSTSEKISSSHDKSKHDHPTLLRGRNVIRAKNIAQKRLSGMDMASLNQIFMIKT